MIFILGSAGTSGATYEEVNTFADLPASTGSGDIRLVRTSTWLAFPPHLSGFYRDEAGGWVRKAPYSAFFLDTKAIWYDDGDSTKRMRFELSGITAGNTRVITAADRNLNLAAPVFDTAEVINYIDIPEQAVPANPAADVGRLYVKDATGTTKLYFRDSAGLETDLLAAAGGDMNAAVYDPAAITEQLVGLTAVQTLTNKTFDAGSIGTGTLVHERGGLEADVSAYAGLVYITGAAT